MAAQGRVERHAVPSAALGHPIDTQVYLPDRDPPATGWPVLYLLHGLGGNAQSWLDLGGIEATLDRMIADGRIAPVVVVMPDGGNGWYVDSRDLGGPGDYQTALSGPLQDWVEQHFAVRRDRGGRAVAGLSMGGYGALRFALLAPERYVSAVSLSGAIWQNVPEADLDTPPERLNLILDSRYFHRLDPMTIVTGPVLPPPGQHFQGAFGTPFQARRFNRLNPFTLLANRLAEHAVLPTLYLSVGDDDSHKLWRGAIAFYETVMAAGARIEFRVTDGDHTWALWRVSVIDALRFVDAQWVAPARLSTK